MFKGIFTTILYNNAHSIFIFRELEQTCSEEADVRKNKGVGKKTTNPRNQSNDSSRSMPMLKDLLIQPSTSSKPHLEIESHNSQQLPTSKNNHGPAGAGQEDHTVHEDVNEDNSAAGDDDNGEISASSHEVTQSDNRYMYGIFTCVGAMLRKQVIEWAKRLQLFLVVVVVVICTRRF